MKRILSVPQSLVRLTESQYEVLKTIAEASRDSLDQYIHSEIIQGLESDIDLYFGHSKTLKERLFRKMKLNNRIDT